MASLNLNSSSLLHRKILQSSPKLNLPAECFNSSTSMNSRKNLPLNYKFDQKLKISKLTETRVSNVDAPQVPCQDDFSASQCYQLVNESQDHIEYIRMLLKTMGDGRMSGSPYDTAWIALIKDVEGRDQPQFPSSLQWIANNQLPDGSWGDEQFFLVYDRLVNTLACVVALRSWNVHVEKCEKGITYIKENVHKLEDGNAKHMTCGFEIVFPALLQRAKDMGINDIPYDDPLIKEINHTRERKLKRIPMDVMYKVRTALLYNLEGLENLDWERLLKLQSPDGSFLQSPSATAFAFMNTKDKKCFQFIKNTAEMFNGGAPSPYPVDLYARLWAVDRLQRLGISRFFEAEIADCLSYIHRFWGDKGIFSGRESGFADIDDTSMGFRLLRMHGYDVDPNVLRNFKHDDKFSCYGGQMIESSTPIYTLYRASQLRFPGEQILEEADKFAYQFLSEQLANNQLFDKWVISEHLHDEISTGLGMPWYATLPRVEARYYLQHNTGANEVWIGRTLYRMPEISNDTYLELAKKDFERCQSQHQIEWIYMKEWYGNRNFQESGISNELLRAYFFACATIFEVERTNERITWAKTQIISKMITSLFSKETTSSYEKQILLREFININGLYKTKSTEREHGVVNIVKATLHEFLNGFDIRTRHQLENAWGIWLTKLQQGEANGAADAELLTSTLNICGHIAFNEEILSHNDYTTLSNLTSKICQQLSVIQSEKVREINGRETAKSSLKNEKLERDMQSLAKLVLENSVELNRNIKQTFLTVAKTYYYRAYNADETMDTHVFKVLFEPVG